MADEEKHSATENRIIAATSYPIFLTDGLSMDFGEPCWTRTSDPLLKRQMLCRLS
jgi:hypothetical protein